MLFLVCVAIFVVLACLVVPGLALAVMLFLDREGAKPSERAGETSGHDARGPRALAEAPPSASPVPSSSLPAGLGRSLVPTVSPAGSRDRVLRRLAVWFWWSAGGRRLAAAIVRIGQKWSLLPSKPVTGVR